MISGGQAPGWTKIPRDRVCLVQRSHTPVSLRFFYSVSGIAAGLNRCIVVEVRQKGIQEMKIVRKHGPCKVGQVGRRGYFS